MIPVTRIDLYLIENNNASELSSIDTVFDEDWVILIVDLFDHTTTKLESLAITEVERYETIIVFIEVQIASC